MNPFLIAIILGIVEGVTEFLPVSSTGHLILAGDLLNFFGEKESSFEIIIQAGAILAVLILYRERFAGLLDFSSGRAPFRGLNGIKKIAVASLPALAIGFLARDFIKSHLFNPIGVAAALVIGGIMMWIIEKEKPAPSVGTLEEISYKKALLIGVAQCFALWPGISRAGATMMGAMMLGVERKAAAEFSFLIAVPILLIATVYELFKSYHLLSMTDIGVFAIGFLVSFVGAVAAIKGFITLLGHWTLRPFAIYRIALGFIVLWFLV